MLVRSFDLTVVPPPPPPRNMGLGCVKYYKVHFWQSYKGDEWGHTPYINTVSDPEKIRTGYTRQSCSVVLVTTFGVILDTAIILRTVFFQSPSVWMQQLPSKSLPLATTCRPAPDDALLHAVSVCPCVYGVLRHTTVINITSHTEIT
jgi:hypothetical protein